MKIRSIVTTMMALGMVATLAGVAAAGQTRSTGAGSAPAGAG